MVSRAAAGRSPVSSNSNRTRSPAKVVNTADSRAVNNRTAKFYFDVESTFLAPATGLLF